MLFYSKSLHNLYKKMMFLSSFLWQNAPPFGIIGFLFFDFAMKLRDKL